MLGRVDQTPHFGVPVVAADDVKGLQNDGKRNAVNKHELKGTGKEFVATNVTYDPIKHDPAKDVAHHIEQANNPIVATNSIKRPSRFLIGAAKAAADSSQTGGSITSSTNKSDLVGFCDGRTTMEVRFSDGATWVSYDDCI